MSETVALPRRWVDLDTIHIGERLREPDMARVTEIAKSIAEIGLLNPPAVRFVDKMVIGGVEEHNVPVLIVGYHRILALQQIGKESVECDVYKVDPLRAELMEIAENLHRAELTALERSEQVSRWIELTSAKHNVSRQADAKPKAVKSGRPEGGVRSAARELNISEPDARRAVKVANLSPAAKAVAKDVSLDDNQSALLEAAKYLEPEKQVVSLQQWRQRKAADLAAAVRPVTIAALAGEEKLKKQLARAKEEAEKKEDQRAAQEHRANIAVKQVDSATSRAMFAEADKERLQAEVDRLTEENERLRADSLQLDDRAMDIAEKLIEMEDQKKLSKISKLINDHLKHPERTPFQRSAALGRIGHEHADGRRFSKAEMAEIHCWRVEGVDAGGQRCGNGVRLGTEDEAKLYADYLAREDNMTTNVIRVPGEPALNTITMNDDGSVSIGFMHGMCGSLEWKPLSIAAAA